MSNEPNNGPGSEKSYLVKRYLFLLSLIVYLPGVFFHDFSPSLLSESQPEVPSFLASVGMEARSGSRVSVKYIELPASETSLSESFARQRQKSKTLWRRFCIL